MNTLWWIGEAGIVFEFGGAILGVLFAWNTRTAWSFSEGTIIKRIEDSPSEFDLSPAKLADLHKRRVTDPIIAAMSEAMGGKENENKPNAPLQDREK